MEKVIGSGGKGNAANGIDYLFSEVIRDRKCSLGLRSGPDCIQQLPWSTGFVGEFFPILIR
jgi:hypothetical protein